MNKGDLDKKTNVYHSRLQPFEKTPTYTLGQDNENKNKLMFEK